MCVKVQLCIKFREIPSEITSRVTLARKLSSHTNILLKIVKSCSGHSKTCDTSKAGSLEFSRKQYFLVQNKVKQSFLPPNRLMSTEITLASYLIVKSMMDVKFCAMPCNRTWDLLITKSLRSRTTAPLVEWFTSKINGHQLMIKEN